MKLENNFPQLELKEKLIDIGARSLDNSTYLYLDINNKRGVYELTYEDKKDNKGNENYLLRKIIDIKK